MNDVKKSGSSNIVKGCLIAFLVLFLLGAIGTVITIGIFYYAYSSSETSYQPISTNETGTSTSETGNDEGKSKSSNPEDIEMVDVSGGSFIMGCNRYCKDDEIPTHGVVLNSFKIGKYELTQAQWTAIMGSNPSAFNGCENCPVENVSWNEVQTFIRKLNSKTGKNYRLPTEAEWEYAARGGANTSIFTYSGSNNLDDVAWHNGNSAGKTKPVGGKKANELGIYDMTGNVTEWCSDWYGPYSDENQVDPIGANSGTGRVLRGGSWNYKGEDCRVFFRGNLLPSAKQNMRGFRLAE
jgi:formylglycine-generating enzyme required for sulfatase activity